MAPSIIPARRTRIRRSRDKWCEVLERFERSGQSREQFCLERGQTLSSAASIAGAGSWVRRRRRDRSVPASPCFSSWRRTHVRRAEHGTWNCSSALAWCCACTVHAERPPGRRIWLCMQPTDIRRSFDGLSALVRQHLGEDPSSGQWFAFINRRRTQIKVLAFEEGGYCVWSKRLEQGRFAAENAAGIARTRVLHTARVCPESMCLLSLPTVRSILLQYALANHRLSRAAAPGAASLGARCPG